MNHCVPDFKPNDDRRPSRSSSPEDELVELLWQNGQVVLQSQNQRSLKKSLPQKPPDESTVRISQPTSTVATEEAPPYQVFMKEDEMSSWLHYPLDEDFCSDLLYPAPSGNYSNSSNTQIPGMSVAAAAAISPPRPPIPRPSALQRVERLDDAQPPAHSNKFHNLIYFSRPKLKPTVKSQPSAVTETTMVDSSDTPAVRRNGKAPVSVSGDGGGDEHDRELTSCDLTVTSSSGGSGASGEPVATASLTDDRKRKASKIGDHDFHNDEDAKFESSDTKKQVHGSTSTRRSRASEVHNLSERRRRDRINEKMKALQELIPRCNKSDKASMLDEAIEYLKSLQLQVQMMSMGCGMVPMVFPGVQQYMSPVGMRMGMGMGMGMGIDMGLNRPMLPFPHVLSGSSMPRPPAATHLGPRLPMPAFHLPAISSANGQPVQATNQADPSLYSFGIQNPHLQIPSFTDPYQHYMSMQQMQAPPCPSQNQATAQPSTSKGDHNLENQKHE